MGQCEERGYGFGYRGWGRKGCTQLGRLEKPCARGAFVLSPPPMPAAVVVLPPDFVAGAVTAVAFVACCPRCSTCALSAAMRSGRVTIFAGKAGTSGGIAASSWLAAPCFLVKGWRTGWCPLGRLLTAVGGGANSRLRRQSSFDSTSSGRAFLIASVISLMVAVRMALDADGLKPIATIRGNVHESFHMASSTSMSCSANTAPAPGLRLPSSTSSDWRNVEASPKS